MVMVVGKMWFGFGEENKGIAAEHDALIRSGGTARMFGQVPSVVTRVYDSGP
jgi:hypothetical protein